MVRDIFCFLSFITTVDKCEAKEEPLLPCYKELSMSNFANALNRTANRSFLGIFKCPVGHYNDYAIIWWATLLTRLRFEPTALVNSLDSEQGLEKLGNYILYFFHQEWWHSTNAYMNHKFFFKKEISQLINIDMFEQIVASHDRSNLFP